MVSGDYAGAPFNGVKEMILEMVGGVRRVASLLCALFAGRLAASSTRSCAFQFAVLPLWTLDGTA